MSIEVQTLAKDVKTYSQIVAKYGPNSSQTLEIRRKLSNDSEFIAFADSLDRLHVNLKKQKAKRLVAKN